MMQTSAPADRISEASARTVVVLPQPPFEDPTVITGICNSPCLCSVTCNAHHVVRCIAIVQCNTIAQAKSQCNATSKANVNCNVLHSIMRYVTRIAKRLNRNVGRQSSNGSINGAAVSTENDRSQSALDHPRRKRPRWEKMGEGGWCVARPATTS